MAINGTALAGLAAGSIFLYAAVKGKSILATTQAIVQGKDPGTIPAANSIQVASGIADTGHALGELPGSGPAPGGGTSPPANANASTYQQYAFSLFSHYGWGTDQQQPLIALWNGESNWDPTAYNPGTHTTNPDNSHAFGIPQALPASKMASAGSDWRTNGFTQIRWGLGYISSVYGSPAKAYSDWLSRNPHWY